MDQLRNLFANELEGEPPPPPGDLAQDVMRQGTRLRRRRTALTAGGAVAGVLAAMTAVFALGLPGSPGTAEPGIGAASSVCSAGDQAMRYELDQVAIFLRPDITPAQRRDLFDTLQVDPLVHSSDFQSKEKAFAQFKKLWQDNPDLLKSVDAEQLPESFRVNLTDPADSERFAARVERLPGVEQVVERTEMRCTTPGAGR